MARPFKQVGAMRVKVTPLTHPELREKFDAWMRDYKGSGPGTNYREMCDDAFGVIEEMLKRSVRIDYLGMPDPDDTTKFTPEPIFFEIIDLEDKVSAVSQLVVGDHAAVQGSHFLLDAKGLRHFRCNGEPGLIDMTGSGSEINKGVS